MNAKVPIKVLLLRNLKIAALLTADTVGGSLLPSAICRLSFLTTVSKFPDVCQEKNGGIGKFRWGNDFGAACTSRSLGFPLFGGNALKRLKRKRKFMLPTRSLPCFRHAYAVE
jgi:hypothetical protein